MLFSGLENTSTVSVSVSTNPQTGACFFWRSAFLCFPAISKVSYTRSKASTASLLPSLLDGNANCTRLQLKTDGVPPTANQCMRDGAAYL